jgi:hypothetical protein
MDHFQINDRLIVSDSVAAVNPFHFHIALASTYHQGAEKCHAAQGPTGGASNYLYDMVEETALAERLFS